MDIAKGSATLTIGILAPTPLAHCKFTSIHLILSSSNCFKPSQAFLTVLTGHLPLTLPSEIKLTATYSMPLFSELKGKLPITFFTVPDKMDKPKGMYLSLKHFLFIIHHVYMSASSCFALCHWLLEDFPHLSPPTSPVTTLPVPLVQCTSPSGISLRCLQLVLGHRQYHHR
jgi:hypothetical protein